MIGNGLYPKPPESALADNAESQVTRAFWIIENACDLRECRRFPMAASMEAARTVGKLVHLSGIFPSECGGRIEMERYNPKGPDDREEEQQENDFFESSKPPSRKPESPRSSSGMKLWLPTYIFPWETLMKLR